MLSESLFFNYISPYQHVDLSHYMSIKKKGSMNLELLSLFFITLHCYFHLESKFILYIILPFSLEFLLKI